MRATTVNGIRFQKHVCRIYRSDYRKKKIVRFKENTNFRGHPVAEPSHAHVHNTSLNRCASQSRQTRLFRLTFASASIAGPLVSRNSFSCKPRDAEIDQYQ